MTHFSFMLIVAVLFAAQSAEAFISPRRSGNGIQDLIKKKHAKMTGESNVTPGASTQDALRMHKEKREKHRRLTKTREEIEEELVQSRMEKKGPFSNPRKDKFQLLNKRRSGDAMKTEDKDEFESATLLDDQVEEPEGQEQQESGEPAHRGTQKKPFHYSIPQGVMDATTREGWQQTKVYMILGMFLFIGGVAGISYYRGRNKMLLPGKLM